VTETETERRERESVCVCVCVCVRVLIVRVGLARVSIAHVYLYLSSVSPRLGGGILGLRLLSYFGLRCNPFLQQMLSSQAARGEANYPVAAAGVSALGHLLQLLELRRLPVPEGPETPNALGLHALMSSTDHPLEDLFCVFYQLIHRNYLRINGGYMSFPAVLEKSKQSLLKILSKQPRTVPELYSIASTM
jgi:ELMO/CED-12 family